MVVYYDAHNHLCDPRLDSFRAGILEELQGLGVRGAVVNSSSEEEWQAIARLAQEHAWIIPAFGVHPWSTAQVRPGWRERWVALLEAHPAATVGEIGLDRWIPNPDLPLQREIFVFQLSVAAARNRPVSIHCLKAWGMLLEVLQSTPLPQRGFLLHSYGGPVEMVPQFTQLGAYFSFSPYFLNDRKALQREVFAQIPPDRLLVETDSPDMWPPKERNLHPLCEVGSGKELNHPLNIEVAYAGLAQIRRLPVQEFAQLVEANFTRLFLG